MSYLVLARKYRPKQFSDIVGQQSVVRTLVNAIKLKRTHQAYVFSGSRGIGKTSIARIFSKALRCPNVMERDGLLVSCDICSDCKEIAAGISVNVLEIDGASNNGVDSVREIRENAKFLPTSGLYKIYIIDEVHMLSTAAFNALLKTLEEPPEHVVFIFATTESHKIPETILGRCQRFDFKRVTVHQIGERVMEVLKAENIEFEPAAINLIARAAEGSMRDALSITDQVISFSGMKVTAQAVKDSIGLIGTELIFAILKDILGRNPRPALALAQNAFNQGVDLRLLLKSLLEMLHALILLQVGVENPVTPFSDDELAQLQTLKNIRPLEENELIFQVYHHGLDLLSRATQPKLVLDLLLIKTSLAETLVKLEDGEAVRAAAPQAPRRAARPEGIKAVAIAESVTESVAVPKTVPVSESISIPSQGFSFHSPSAGAAKKDGPEAQDQKISTPHAPEGPKTWEKFIEMSFERLPMLSVILESAVEWRLPQNETEKVRLGFREKDRMKIDQLLSKNFRDPFLGFTESFFGFRAMPEPYVTESRAESLAEKNARRRKESEAQKLRSIHENKVVQEAKSLFGADLTHIEFYGARRMNPLSKLIFELSKLPGIGEKTATRLAYYILNQDAAYSEGLAHALLDAKRRLRYCEQCFNFSERERCEICEDPSRDALQICVVERPSDVTPIERTGTYRGVYHVLHGLLSPMDGIGPEDLKMKPLFLRLKAQEVREVIFALNPSVEGEATTLYLSRLLKPAGIKLSQVAYGIPFGGTIEFTDRQTLGKALENRTEMGGS